MEIAEIKELMEDFKESGCTRLEVQQGEFKLVLEGNKAHSTEVSRIHTIESSQVKSESDTEASAKENSMEKKVEAPENEGELVKAPLVGIFYAAPSPEAMPYVQVGSKVEKGQVICLIEAMKMMSEVTAPRGGVIKKIYVKNQDVIGFDDPLFLIGD